MEKIGSMVMVNKMTKPFSWESLNCASERNCRWCVLRPASKANHRFYSDDSINEISMDCCIGCWEFSLLP
jgi:hypothetical protein